MNRNESENAVREAVDGARHLARQLEQSQTELAGLLPLSATALRALDQAGWNALYAFQMKFLLLQDLASRRLVRGFLDLAGEDPRGFSMREASDRVAELGALTSGDDWLQLAVVRNMLVHDYPLDLDQFIVRIVDAHLHCSSLLSNVAMLVAALTSEPRT